MAISAADSPPDLRCTLLTISLRKQGARWNQVSPGCGSKWIKQLRQTKESYAAAPIEPGRSSLENQRKMLNHFLHTPPKLKHSFFKKLRSVKNPALLEVGYLGSTGCPEAAENSQQCPPGTPAPNRLLGFLCCSLGTCLLTD